MTFGHGMQDKEKNENNSLYMFASLVAQVLA
jgi:hypothetical protein